VSVFCNLAAGLAAPRLPECIPEADEEPFRGWARTGSSTSVADLRAATSVAAAIWSFLFEKPVFQRRAIACLTGGKLGENPDFSLRRD
jgi:hypothetical protein